MQATIYVAWNGTGTALQHLLELFVAVIPAEMRQELEFRRFETIPVRSWYEIVVEQMQNEPAQGVLLRYGTALSGDVREL